MEMTLIQEQPLADNVSFGTKITGITSETVKDESVRKRLRDLFESRGLLVFEDVEPSDQMLIAISSAVGPLQDIVLNAVPRVDKEALPGILRFNNDPSDANVFEIDGKKVSGWTGWHFDSCYKALCRGAGLRVTINPPAGGETGFADGIQLYKAISPELRAKFQDLKIFYNTKLMFNQQRFGMPKKFRTISIQEHAQKLFKEAETRPRAMHPAVWQRSTGEYVLHAAPFQADGIVGHEGPEGDSLLESLFQEIYAKMAVYWHTWKMTDVVVWDNWRLIHTANGHDPNHARCVHRATIQGDYGLGSIEAIARKPQSEPASVR
jgi:taurine dioxygenase